MKTTTLAWTSLILGVLAATLFLPPTAGANNPLRPLPGNPRYFTDNSGQPIVLTGSHTWHVFQDYWPDPTLPDFDYSTWISDLAGWGHNFSRGWVWMDSLYTPSPYLTVWPNLDPTCDQSPPQVPYFRLNKRNHQYFDRLRARIQQADTSGIYVSVMLFQGWSVEEKDIVDGALRDPNPWPSHPFHEGRNCEGIDGDGNPNQDLIDGRNIHRGSPNSQITLLQKDYVKSVINSLCDLDNILWEISNESHHSSLGWQEDMVRFVQNYEQNHSSCAGPGFRRHPVWISCVSNSEGNRNADNATLFASAADVVSPCGGDGSCGEGNKGKPYFKSPPASTGDKVVIADSDHICVLRTDSFWNWRSFMRGLHPILMDFYTSLPWYGALPVQPQNLRDSLGTMQEMAARVDMAKMVPQTGGSMPSSTSYALFSTSNPRESAPSPNGAEFLVYQRTARTSVKVCNLSPASDYKFRWFRASSGSALTGTLPRNNVTSCESFNNPHSSDAVLLLQRIGSVTGTVSAAVTSHPSSVTVTEGSPATFLVTSTGTSPMSSQWQKLVGGSWVNLADGGGLSGTVSSTLAINWASLTDAGQYRCVVSNAFGTDFSSPATLTVEGEAPQITLHPQPATAKIDTTVTFSCAATGNPAPIFGWFKDGTAVVDDGRITGAATSTMTILDVDQGDRGSYHCRATNGIGSADSATATLKVTTVGSLTLEQLILLILN